MSDIDFTILPPDGRLFESMVGKLLEADGYEILKHPGVGPDGGCDLLVSRRLTDSMGTKVETVLVQCKHTAHSGKAVSPAALDNWKHAMLSFGASGFLLVTDTGVTHNISSGFAAFNKASKSEWARIWTKADLISLLHKYPQVRAAFFPVEFRPDAQEAVERLGEKLFESASKADRFFNTQNWEKFAETVNATRELLGNTAKVPGHFEIAYHFKRLQRFDELRRILSTQQLAFERLIEARAVKIIVNSASTARPTLASLESTLAGEDPYHAKTFALAQQEARRLASLIPDNRHVVMVGCGAFSHTLLSISITNPSISCTGLDYDNTCLLQALKVRERLGLENRLYYITADGDVYDYKDADMVIIANIVTSKERVLKRVIRTAKSGSIVVLRNPVTLGEALWEDSKYSGIKGAVRIDRFDSDSFGQCFEVVVLRCQKAVA